MVSTQNMTCRILFFPIHEMDCFPAMAPPIMMKLLIAHKISEQRLIVFSPNITFCFSNAGKIDYSAKLKLILPWTIQF